MSISTTRYRDQSVFHLAFATRAVELGFVAAGVTVCVAAALQTLGTLLGWLAAL